MLWWQENLAEAEQPPRWMWTLEWELEHWFAQVKQARKDKDHSGGGPVTVQEPDERMSQNQLAKAFRERMGTS